MTQFSDLDQENSERARVELLVMEGLRSGEAVEITPRFWEELRENLRSRRKQDS